MKEISLRLKSYDHRTLDFGVQKILDVVKKTGASISNLIPLPTDKQIYTVLRAVHKYKDSREQFEMRTHKRLISIKNPNKDTINALKNLDLPSGLDIDIKL